MNPDLDPRGDLGEAVRQVLKEQRHFLGYSRPKLSRLSGVHESTIGRLEAAGGDVYLGTLQRLAHALQLDLSEFLEEVERKAHMGADKDPRVLADRHIDRAKFWLGQIAPTDQGRTDR